MANLKFYKSNSLPSSAAEGSVGFEPSSKTIKLKTSSGWEVFGAANPTSLPASDVYAWAKAATKPTYTYSEVGAQPAGSYATLDSSGKVPSSQLPSYVDDVLEYSGVASFPGTGETGKIYVDTKTNLTYRWSGSAYVEISPSIALGETSSTAYAGDKGKTVATNLTNHTGNTTIHITAEERTKWNNAASTISTNGHKLYKASEVTEYTSDDGGVTPLTVRNAFNTITAANATNATKAATVSGIYTQSGGAQMPSYIAGGTVRFNMMNKFNNVQSFESYADVMMMDCYTGGDVPYVTALALNKSGTPKAWIATGAKGDTEKWYASAELITSKNISSQTVSKATTADTANSVAWGNVSSKPTFAAVATSGSYTDLSSKPTIPTVNNPTITITQDDAVRGTFTLNQSGDATIALTDRTILPDYVVRSIEILPSDASITLALGKTTVFILTKATTFILPSAPQTNDAKLKEVVLKMKIGSSVYTTTWPSGLAWPNGEIPTLEANTYYEFNFSYTYDTWCVAYQAFTIVS